MVRQVSKEKRDACKIGTILPRYLPIQYLSPQVSACLYQEIQRPPCSIIIPNHHPSKVEIHLHVFVCYYYSHSCCDFIPLFFVSICRNDVLPNQNFANGYTTLNSLLDQQPCSNKAHQFQSFSFLSSLRPFTRKRKRNVTCLLTSSINFVIMIELKFQSYCNQIILTSYQRQFKIVKGSSPVV